MERAILSWHEEVTTRARLLSGRASPGCRVERRRVASACLLQRGNAPPAHRSGRGGGGGVGRGIQAPAGYSTPCGRSRGSEGGPECGVWACPSRGGNPNRTRGVGRCG